MNNRKINQEINWEINQDNNLDGMGNSLVIVSTSFKRGLFDI